MLLPSQSGGSAPSSATVYANVVEGPPVYICIPAHHPRNCFAYLSSAHFYFFVFRQLSSDENVSGATSETGNRANNNTSDHTIIILNDPISLLDNSHWQVLGVNSSNKPLKSGTLEGG